jgi:hypothetical protein
LSTWEIWVKKLIAKNLGLVIIINIHKTLKIQKFIGSANMEVGALKYKSKGEVKFNIMKDKLFKRGGEGRALLISNTHFIE